MAKKRIIRFKGIKLRFDEPIDERTMALLKSRLEGAYAILLKRAKKKLSKIYKSK